MGPWELVVLAFPGERLSADALTALTGLRAAHDIEVLDTLVVTVAADGTVTTAELSDLDGAQPVADDEPSLIGPEDAAEVAATLAPGNIALLTLVEHRWAADAADAVRAAGGRIHASVRIAPEHARAALDAGRLS